MYEYKTAARDLFAPAKSKVRKGSGETLVENAENLRRRPVAHSRVAAECLSALVCGKGASAVSPRERFLVIVLPVDCSLCVYGVFVFVRVYKYVVYALSLLQIIRSYE